MIHTIVADSEGNPLINAPVTLRVRTNGTLVRDAEASSTRYNALTLRTDAQGFIGDTPDRFVYYTSGSQSGVETVEIVAGDSSERTFTFTVIESGTTSQPIDFRKRYHSDGSTTLSWRGAMMDTDELVIRMLGTDGSWQVIDRLTNLETDWPVRNPLTSRYEMTLNSTDKADVFQIGKKAPDDASYTYSNHAGLPTPNYAIIPVDSDADIRAIANNGWILLSGGVRWKLGVAEQLVLPAGADPDLGFNAVDMNNAGHVIGDGYTLPDSYHSRTPIHWSSESSVGSYLSGLPAAAVQASHIDDEGNFYGDYFRSTEITPPRSYPCILHDLEDGILVPYTWTCQFYQSFFSEHYEYASNIVDNRYTDLAYSFQYSDALMPFTTLSSTPIGEFISFNDTYYDWETRTLDYIFMKRNDWGYYEDQTRTAVSNFAPANLGMIPHHIGKGRVVVGTTEASGGAYCIWKDGATTLLGEVPGGLSHPRIFIAHLNNDEELIIAGESMWQTIKDPDGEVTGNYVRSSLNQLVDPDSGWTDLRAHKVSDNGYIAGKGQFNGAFTTFLLVPGVDIVPDYDRDGVIREQAWTDDDGKVHPSDYQKAADDVPFYFWINNDGDHEGKDIPNGFADDSLRLGVGGVGDLIDFFPVYIDFNGLLENLDVSKVQIELLGPDVAWLDFPEDYVGLNENSAKFYLENVTRAEEWGSATTTVAGDGVYFTQKMVERIRDGRGIVLLEGREASDEVLKLRFTYDDTVLFTQEMNLKLSHVEDMYRHINLLSDLGQSGGVATDTNEPSGLPDRESNNKHFVFVHGYNVNPEQARGWNAEVFKRLYWSGSRAKFTGVTWYGYESQIPGLNKAPNYYENIIHATRTGEYLSNALSNYTGDLTIAGHSMGNIVVSSAISDHGLDYDRYFLLNAAVALEAYDEAILEVPVNPNMVNNMTHKDFRPYSAYANKLYASHWHTLFTDNRRKLTWKDRFVAVADQGKAYNFYSLGEEVLNNANGNSPPGIFGGALSGEKAWFNQEWSKGRLLIGTLPGVNRAGGWSMNTDHWHTVDVASGDSYILTPTEAGMLTKEELRLHPFFRLFKSDDPNYPAYDGDELYASDSDIAADYQAGLYITRAKLLGEAIPALSYATGRNSHTLAFGDNNINIDDGIYRSGWPNFRDDLNWKHSDMKNVAYVYNRPFYNKLIETGELDEK